MRSARRLWAGIPGLEIDGTTDGARDTGNHPRRSSEHQRYQKGATSDSLNTASPFQVRRAETT